jgi:cytochrome c peroxidase
MKKAGFLLMTVALMALALGLGCGKGPSETIDPAKLSMFSPLPESIPSKAGALTEEKVSLGRMLFYDTRLSKSQKISCNSCHDLAKYGVDGEPTSDGHKGQKGDRNSPTVYNAAAEFVQFWDGRAADVEEQAKGPVLNPVEMAMTDDKAVLKVVKSIPEYVAAFQKAFPEDKDPVTYDNMAKAIGAFERKLVTPSRWDKLLKGDQNALTAEEKVGFNTFLEASCQTCHAGTLMGGNMYQKAGLVKPWPNQLDPGRFKVTKADADKMMFKVPTLRNIEKTGPYFHDGKTATLAEAIKIMGDFQLGTTLTDAQVKSIGTWLKTLTGEIPTDYIKPPELPKSTPRTPKPDLTD